MAAMLARGSRVQGDGILREKCYGHSEPNFVKKDPPDQRKKDCGVAAMVAFDTMLAKHEVQSHASIQEHITCALTSCEHHGSICCV
jgi:hypothetical protein